VCEYGSGVCALFGPFFTCHIVHDTEERDYPRMPLTTSKDKCVSLSLWLKCASLAPGVQLMLKPIRWLLKPSTGLAGMSGHCAFESSWENIL
jgi:hypothetical protein